MNEEVSFWMRETSVSSGDPSFPFIATRGYDSVVWNRLYSRDSADTKFHSMQASLSHKNIL